MEFIGFGVVGENRGRADVIGREIVNVDGEKDRSKDTALWHATEYIIRLGEFGVHFDLLCPVE